MAWGTLTVGRVTLRESYTASYRVNMNTGEQTLGVNAVEWSAGAITMAQIKARREGLMSMQGTVVPVVFSMKSDHTGFYEVVDVGVEHTDWDEADHFTWTLGLRRVGFETTVDIESRLTGMARLNAFVLTGERWHAPSVGATGYDTGSTTPTSTVNRTSTDGIITVYRGIPTVDPRWSITPALYSGGRARVLVDGIERMGTGFKTSSSWEISNGLIRVTPLTSAGLLSVASYDGTTWEAKAWNVQVGTNLTTFDQMTVLRNDYEMVTIRLFRTQSPYGRVYVDLTIRRGSRFVEGYIQVSAANTLGLSLNTVEAFTNNSATGYMVATANDAAGNRGVVGSAQTFTGNTNGGLSKAATTTLDFFVGSVVGGGSAATGDTAINLRDQYIGTMAETTMVVKR